MQRSRCIAHPASIETHIDDRLLHFRQAPAVAIVEQETPFGTEGVLAEITLGTAGRFAAFDDLVTLTVRAADGDECHGPFLPMRSYEDEAQCDIHLSPSPLLKHYPAIAQQVGLGLRTVQRDLRSPTFAGRKRHRDLGTRSVLNPYKPYLLERWNAGCHSPAAVSRT